MRRSLLLVLMTSLILGCIELQVLAQAEEIQPAVPGSVQPDTMLLKRSPVLDGVIQGGEWDQFFQIQQAEYSATAYANWDEEHLYIAVQGNLPTDVMVTLDGSNDGWFHGDDNYLLKALTEAGGNPSISLERYNSRSKVVTPGATETLDSSVIQWKGSDPEKPAVLEFALPVSAFEGLKLGPSRSVGLSISLRPAIEGSLWTPMATLGNVQECTMSDRKAAAMDQIDITMALQDAKVVAGQTLLAKISVRNKSAQAVPLQSLVIGGDGRAGEFMNSQRIRLEGLEPGKSYTCRYQTKIPSDMPLGSWAVGAEGLSDAGGVGRIGAVLASFEVVEPFVLDIDVGEDPMIVGVDKERAVRIVIRNQTPRRVSGEAAIGLPDGWRLSPNFARRRFVAEAEDSVTELRFKVRPPADASAGEVTITADVNLDGQKYGLGKNLVLIAPDAPM